MEDRTGFDNTGNAVDPRRRDASSVLGASSRIALRKCKTGQPSGDVSDRLTVTERLQARQYQIKTVNVVFILASPPRKGRSSLGIGSTKERFR